MIQFFRRLGFAITYVVWLVPSLILVIAMGVLGGLAGLAIWLVSGRDYWDGIDDIVWRPLNLPYWIFGYRY